MKPIRTDTGRFELSAIDSVAQIQFGHRQFPQIHVLPCGDWAVFFCWTDDAYFAKSGFLRSRDRGRTWAEEGWATDSGCLVPLGGDELGIFDSYYPLHKGGDDFVVRACFSSDGGRSFGPVDHHIPVHCPGAKVYTLAELLQTYFGLPCFPWNRFFKANGYPHIAPGWPETAKQIRFGGAGPSSQTVRLADGRLVSMNYCWAPGGPKLPVGYSIAFAVESTDRGRSWRQIGVVPWSESFGGEGAVFGGAGFTEAGLVQLADGDLLIVLRAGSGLPMGTSRSSDGGRTWSTPGIVRLENSPDQAKGVFPVMIRMSTGMLACVYGRPGVHLMTDPTGTGLHWEHEIELESVEQQLCSERGSTQSGFYSTENIGLAEVGPGELAMTYDLWGWKESADKASVRQTIRMARFVLR